jgi:soluble cytochrome b562
MDSGAGLAIGLESILTSTQEEWYKPLQSTKYLWRRQLLKSFSPIVNILTSSGPERMALDADNIISEAKRRTGLDDFGGDDFREGLKVLVQSLESDAHLSPFGRILIGKQVINALVSRLRLVSFKKRHAQLFAAPLVPPLFVVGLPRSGTTFLHRLLSSLPAARPIPMWEIVEPIRGRGLDLRKLRGWLISTSTRFLAPDLDAKHELRHDRPDECIFLFNSTMVSIGYWQMAPVYDYADWCLKQDISGPFSWYRQFLQYLQASCPDRRLTLKAPAYTGQLEALFGTIPNALVVQTHRDPRAVLPSTLSLFETVHGLVSDQPDTTRMVQTNLNLLSTLLNDNLKALKRIAADRVLHVHYEALTADPIGIVQKIHEHFNLPWSSLHITALEAALKIHRKGKYGSHRYSLDDFGLSEAKVSEVFYDYMARFV